MSETQVNETDHIHQPLHAQPAATYGINPPLPSSLRRGPRPWPLAARLAVAVLVIGLATGFAMSLITLRSVSTRETRDSRTISQLSQALGVNASQTTQNGGSVSQLNRELSGVQARLRSLLPPGLAHYGVCLVRTTDNATGDLANITLVAPVVTAGSYTCPQGNFVSVVPVQS
jgi:hypothetical protein